jgi:hypothetical protein
VIALDRDLPGVHGDTLFTRRLEDRSAVFGVLAEIETLGLELLALRHITTGPKSP